MDRVIHLVPVGSQVPGSAGRLSDGTVASNSPRAGGGEVLWGLHAAAH